MILQLLLSFCLSTSSIRSIEHDPYVSANSVKNHFIATSDSLTVYVFLMDECVISQFYTPLLGDFYKKYNCQKVGFIGYFPSFATKPDKIESFGKKYKLDFPLKQDYYKDWTKKFGVTITPEVAVWDHRSERLIYRGRIDDSYVRVGKRKLHPQSNDLKNVIENWLVGKVPDSTVETNAVGCFINFNDAISAPRTPKGGEN